MGHVENVLRYLEGLEIYAEDGDADFILTPTDFSRANQPWCVYAWKRGSEVLYVGSSSNLYARLANHTILGVKEPLLPDDKILVFTCENKGRMLDAERALITHYSPKYNTVGSRTVKAEREREALEKLKARCRAYVSKSVSTTLPK